MKNNQDIEKLILQRKFTAATQKIKALKDQTTRDCWKAFDHALSLDNVLAENRIHELGNEKTTSYQKVLLSMTRIQLAFNKKENLSTIKDDVQKIEAYRSKTPYMYYMLGCYYWSIRDQENAILNHKKLYQLLPDDAILYRSAAMYHSFKRYADAKIVIEKAKPSVRRSVDLIILMLESKLWAFVIYTLLLAFLTILLQIPWNFIIFLIFVSLTIVFYIKKDNIAYLFFLGGAVSVLIFIILSIPYSLIILPTLRS